MALTVMVRANHRLRSSKKRRDREAWVSQQFLVMFEPICFNVDKGICFNVDKDCAHLQKRIPF